MLPAVGHATRAMNELLRDTGSDATARYPDTIEAALEDGFALVSALNATGSLLVTGCNNGRARVCLVPPHAPSVVFTFYVIFVVRTECNQYNPFALVLYVFSSSLTGDANLYNRVHTAVGHDHSIVCAGAHWTCGPADIARVC